MRDIMLQIDTYAEPLPPAAIAQAVGFARALDAELTALIRLIRATRAP